MCQARRPPHDDADRRGHRVRVRAFAKDYVGLDYHNEGHTHIDAFSHVAFEGSFFDGNPEASVTADGADAGAIDILKDGLVGRGVLLDVPRARGVAWLEPGEHVFRDDLEAAERLQGVSVAAGDILLVRTGHARRLARARAVGHPRRRSPGCTPRRRGFWPSAQISVLGSDGNNDTAPSTTEGVAFPMHVLAINAMECTCSTTSSSRTWCRTCEAAGRWEFLFVAAPCASSEEPARLSTPSRSSDPPLRSYPRRRRPSSTAATAET